MATEYRETKKESTDITEMLNMSGHKKNTLESSNSTRCNPKKKILIVQVWHRKVVLSMKGYKVFNPDWTCKGYQFEVGKTFEEDVKPECCNRGFHFCTEASDCFNYYKFDPNNKVAEVEAVGYIDTHSDDSKCSTNKLHIIREITWQEVLELVNLGKACTGLRNSGNCNSGNRNSGNCNSGNRNSGNCNSGNRNSGNCNSGNRNIGLRNSGNRNSGDWNSGDCNSGNRNSGNCNSGDCNSGDCNSGNRNSGDCNSGNRNSGNCNSGNRNSGDCNSGNRNSGDWNKTCFSNGCFNTESPKIFLFNKPSEWTYQDWLNSDASYILRNVPSNVLSWIDEDNMTDKEKQEHPEYSVTGGFVKHIKKEAGKQRWWDALDDRKKENVMNLPNFDKDIFEKITGIRIEEQVVTVW